MSRENQNTKSAKNAKERNFSAISAASCEN